MFVILKVPPGNADFKIGVSMRENSWEDGMKKRSVLVVSLCAILALTIAVITGCASQNEDSSSSQTQETTTDSTTESTSGEETEFQKAQASLDENLHADDIDKSQCAGKSYGLILSSLGNEFWQTEREGAEAAAEDYGATLDVQATDNDTDFTGQLDIMETMISKDYAAIGVSPLSETNLVNGIAKANQQGTKVILNGTLQNEDAMKAANAQVDGIMEMDFHQQGVMAGEFAAEQCGNTGQAAIIAGTEGATQSDGRRDGAKEVFEEKGMEVVAVQQCDFDQQKAYDATKQIMQANPDIVAITCGNDDMAMGVVKALEELGKNDQVVVVGNDFTSEAKAAIKDGSLDASVAMSPYLGGRATMITMIRASQGKEIGTVSSYVPMILVSKDNVADMDDWK